MSRAARRSRSLPAGPVVYLLHFATPYQHARHYLGWSACLRARLAHHLGGRGARLMAAVAGAGIDVTVARVWAGADRTDERRLHNRKENRALCPICSGPQALRRAVLISLKEL
jgi:hypothetical protein